MATSDDKLIEAVSSLIKEMGDQNKSLKKEKGRLENCLDEMESEMKATRRSRRKYDRSKKQLQLANSELRNQLLDAKQTPAPRTGPRRRRRKKAR